MQLWRIWRALLWIRPYRYPVLAGSALVQFYCGTNLMAQTSVPLGHDMAQIPASSASAGLGAFLIDRHEVTVGQFRAFVRSTGFKTKAEQEGGGFQYLGGWQRMQDWTWATPYGSPAADAEPAAHLTWHEAGAYCAWAGLRLPTDAEWLLAAYVETRAAPPPPFVQGQRYPYPTGASPTAANHISTPLKFKGYTAPTSKIGQGRGHLPVKTTAPGVNGLWDMGGNLWEWVDHDVAGQKRTRGGSWWYGDAQMRADALYEKDSGFPAVYIGFRCARDA